MTLSIFGAPGRLAWPADCPNLATPWLGILERVCVYSSMLRVATHGIALMAGKSNLEGRFSVRTNRRERIT